MQSKDGLPKTTRRTPIKANVIAALMTTTAATVALLPTPALAQQASAEARSFDIPPQSLPDALVLFGRQAGLEVSAESANTRGRTTQGVSGSLAPGDALSRLLAGTGLTYRWISDRAVMVEPGAAAAASDSNSITLGAVRVQGEGSGRGTGTVRPPADTRGTYTVPATSSATKLDLAIKDTPQIVNVITRQRIEDQNLTQVADVIAQAPGITLQTQGVPGMGRLQYYSRGFPVTNVMLDGVVTTGAGNRDFDLWSVLDTAIYDRIEFVQGSTGLATGSGDPSASVNFVRKRPTEELLAEAKVSYGSWERIRGEVDLSSPLNKSGTIRARFVGAYQQGDTWQDRVETKMGTAYGIVEADPTDTILLTAGLLWTKMRVNDAVPFGMNPAGSQQAANVPFPILNLGRSFNPATQWSYGEMEMLNPFAKLEWRFAEDWRVNLNYMFSKVSQDRMYGGIGQYYYDPIRDTSSYTFGRAKVDGRIHNVDAALTGKFHLLGREHDVVAGFSGYWGSMDNPMYAPIGGGPNTVRISQWNNGDIPLPTSGVPEIFPGVPYVLNDLLLAPGAWGYLKEKQYAGYFGARLRPLNRVSLVFGGRLNRWERSSETYGPDTMAMFTPPYELKFVISEGNTYNATVKGKFTPYAGVIFDITNNITAYASYTGIERANVNWENGVWYRDFYGDPLPPLRGNTVEIGVKAGLFDNRLNIQLAGYRMKQKNEPIWGGERYIEARDEAGGCARVNNPFDLFGRSAPCAVPGDGFISKGIDFSLSGQLAPRINLSASYSYLDQKFAASGDRSCAVSSTNRLDSIQGNRVDGAGFLCPTHTVKIFGTWQATDDLTLGAGGTWKSGTISSWPLVNEENPYSARDQGSFAVVDLLARYRVNRQVMLSANINNLFDKTYLTSSSTSGGFWGAPRNVMVSLAFRY